MTDINDFIYAQHVTKYEFFIPNTFILFIATQKRSSFKINSEDAKYYGLLILVIQRIITKIRLSQIGFTSDFLDLALK